MFGNLLLIELGCVATQRAFRRQQNVGFLTNGHVHRAMNGGCIRGNVSCDRNLSCRHAQLNAGFLGNAISIDQCHACHNDDAND